VSEPSATHLTIGVGSRRLLVPLDQVEAVVLTPTVTPVPAAPPELVGLFNHRGAVYPAVRPLADVSTDGRHAVLVQTSRFGRFALVCDWVHDLGVAAIDDEILDVDTVGQRVVDAQSGIAARLTRAVAPRAVIRLKPGGSPSAQP
jgi:chemotaxis signal transduction protein